MDIQDAILWGAVGGAAVVIGARMAISRHRPDDYWLGRGRCPECKARKLVPVPVTAASAIISCDACEAQWSVVNVDGEAITQAVGPAAYVPPLVLSITDQGQGMLFKTKLGEAYFFSDDQFSVVLTQPRPTPRAMLQKIADLGIAPIWCSAKGDTIDPWRDFLLSAGITSERTE